MQHTASDGCGKRTLGGGESVDRDRGDRRQPCSERWDTAFQRGSEWTPGDDQGAPSCESEPAVDVYIANKSPLGVPFASLDVAAQNEHLEVVRELIQVCGIEGFGGSSGGVHVLQAAVANQHVDIMELLTRNGVVDTGTALITAIDLRELPVKFLLHTARGVEG